MLGGGCCTGDALPGAFFLFFFFKYCQLLPAFPKHSSGYFSPLPGAESKTQRSYFAMGPWG